MTTISAAKAAVEGIEEVMKGEDKPMALQEYHRQDAEGALAAKR